MKDWEGKDKLDFIPINKKISDHWDSSRDFRLFFLDGQDWREGRMAKSNPNAEKTIAYCAMSLIQRGPNRIEKGKCHGFSKNEKNYMETVLGKIPDIDRNEPIHIPRYNGVSFKHFNDKAHDERYYRAYHMLRTLWYFITTHPDGSTFQEKWKRFWEQKKLFSKTEVNPEYYAPLWMRQTAS